MAGPILTTNGLIPQPQGVSNLVATQWAVAAGTADILQAAYSTPNTALYDGMILGVRAAYANLTTTPTFSPDGLTAYTIVKGPLDELRPGDIPGAGADIFLRFDLASTVWVLLNPYVYSREPAYDWVIAGGTADALTAVYVPAHDELVDGLVVRVRAAAANTIAAPTLSVDTTTARIIYQNGKLALVANSILINHDMILVYHADATPWWELLNPCPLSAGPGTWAIAAGTVDVITATYSPVNTSLIDGMQLSFRASGINLTSAPTLNVDTLGAKQIYRRGKALVYVGDIVLAQEVTVRYHSSGTWWELLNPAGGVQTQALATDDATATDVNTALNWFPSGTGGITLGNSNEYEFEGLLRLSRVAGTTSHTTANLFGGTATFDYIEGWVEALTGDAAALGAANGLPFAVATATVVKAASTSATEQTLIRVRGRLKVAVAGTGSFIPQFILSAAAGGISTRKAGSYFRMWPAAVEGTWTG